MLHLYWFFDVRFDDRLVSGIHLQHDESGRRIVVAVALAAASTHSTLTPYLAIPLAVVGTAIAFLRRRRR